MHMEEKDDNTYLLAGSNLDIPGSEVDDTLENVGSEEEEYNFYSLGGDDHHDLEVSNIKHTVNMKQI